MNIQDIREPRPDARGWSVSGRMGLLAEEIAEDRPGIRGLEPGDALRVKDVVGFVTSVEMTAEQSGWLTRVKGMADVARLARYAPQKTLMYMSMSEDEKLSFDHMNRFTYDHLDYVPLIRVGDRYGRKAWYANDVIRDLVSRIPGLDCTVNTYNYMVRQVVAGSDRSYIDTVLSLVSMFEPIVYIDGGTLYILQEPLRAGSVRFGGITGVRYSMMYSPDTRVKKIVVEGGLGPFREDRYRGYRVKGRKDVIVTETVEEGGAAASVTEKYSVDIDGSYRCLRLRRSDLREQDSAARTEETVVVYDHDDVRLYENPRILKEEKRVVETVKYLAGLRPEGLNYVPVYAWSTKEEKEIRTYGYAARAFMNSNNQLVPEGALLEMRRTVYGPAMVVKKAFGTPLNKWLYQLTPSGGSPAIVDLVYDDGSRAVTEEYAETVTVPYLEERTEYIQNTRDTYIEKHHVWKSKESWVGDQEKTYQTTVEIRRGRIPTAPSTPRRMNVYARWGPEDEGTMEEAAVTVSNANIIDWDDAEQILGLIKRNKLGKSYDVAVELVVAGDLAGKIRTGQRVNIGTIMLPDGTVLPVSGEMYVYSYDVTRDDRGVVSTVRLRGKV